MTTVVVDEMRRRLGAVRRPRPIMGRDRERALTDRQRELLDQMEHLFARRLRDADDGRARAHG